MTHVWIARNNEGRCSEPFLATVKQVQDAPEFKGNGYSLFGMPKKDWSGCGWDYVTFFSLAPVLIQPD